VGRLVNAGGTVANPTNSIVTTREKEGNWTGRLRVERTF
jgi:hypothetical protein